MLDSVQPILIYIYRYLDPGQMAGGRHRRKREYPQPPPPSRNNTSTTINIVDISLPLLHPEGVQIWGQADVRERMKQKLDGSGS